MTGFADVVDMTKFTRDRQDYETLKKAALKYAAMKGDVFLERDLERAANNIRRIVWNQHRR